MRSISGESFRPLTKLHGYAPWIPHHDQSRAIGERVFDEKSGARFFEPHAVALSIYRNHREMEQQRMRAWKIDRGSSRIAIQFDHNSPRIVRQKMCKRRFLSLAGDREAKMLN